MKTRSTQSRRLATANPYAAYDAFLRLCKRHKVRPVVVDNLDGFGIAIDAQGVTYANCGPITNGVLTPSKATSLDPIPLSWSVKWFNVIAKESKEWTQFEGAFNKWLSGVTKFVSRHEQLS